MKEVKINNMIKFYTVSLLAANPKHGYELIKELQEKLGRKISASNVYPFLNTLKKSRLIAISKKGKREKKVYLLTPEGRKFTGQMFAKFGDLIAIAISPRITTCTHCGCKVYEGGHIERIKNKLLKFCCCHCAKTYKEEIYSR